MLRSAEELEGLYVELKTKYSGRNSNIVLMQDFFDGRHWALDAEGGEIESDTTATGEGATEETLTVNYSRVVVLKYASVLSKAFRIQVPEPAVPDARKSAQRREGFLLSLMSGLMKAYRRAEHNACKVGFGVVQAVFSKHDMAPQVRQMGVGEDTRFVHEYSFGPGGYRSAFHFRSVPPEDFYPVFTGYDDPNEDLWYVMRADRNRLVAEIRERYKVSLEASGGFDMLDDQHVEPMCNLIHYWDKDDYYLVALTQRRAQVKRRGGPQGYGDRSEVVGSGSSAVVLEHAKHLWGRPPFWIVQNIFAGEADPTWLGTCSDIVAIKELNRRYNETLSDSATEIRLHIKKPLVYKSDEPQQDPASIEFESGAVIPIGAEEDLNPMDWDPVPDAVERLLDRYERAINHLSFLNDAAFGNPPSGSTGVGIRMAFAPMLQLLDLKVPQRIDTLQHLLGSILAYTEKLLAPVQVGNGASAGGTGSASGAAKSDGRLLYRNKNGKKFVVTDLEASDISGDYDVSVVFDQVLPFDEIQRDQNEVYKTKSKTQSLRETMRLRGVQDIDRAIEELKAELSDEVLNPEHALIIEQVKQLKGAGGQPVPGGSGGPGGAGGLQAIPSQPVPGGQQEAPMTPGVPTPGMEGEGGGGPPGGGMNVGGMPRPMVGAGLNPGAGMPGPGINIGGGGMG